MLEAREEDIDRITELFYRILKGEIPQPLVLPKDYPDNEIRQVAEYANRFATEYHAIANAMSALSRGELDFDVPTGKMHILQSFKNLHANLRHLTWKTQQIAGGDLSQHVDFMGGFSEAFNSMAQQLREAFAKIDRQNQDLSHANQRMKRDLDAAAKIQQSLLPTDVPALRQMRFAWRFRPCDELAGDSLNAFAIDDRHVCMYVLDVMGHGVPAALLSVAVTRSLTLGTDRSSLVTQPSKDPPGYTVTSPAEVARRLNVIYPMDASGEAGQYFTIVYGILDTQTGQFRFVAAGHPDPVLVRHGEVTEIVDEPAFPIGMIAEAEYTETVVDLRPGDRLYMHSDGVNEERNDAGEQLGTEKLGALFLEGLDTELEESIEHVIQNVISWRGDEHFADDVSILAVEMLDG